MEKFSKIREPAEIRIHPYMMDHQVEGKAVLPAVEGMQILAASTQSYIPDTNINYMLQASFGKFLYLRPGESKIEVFNEIEADEAGNIVSKLITLSKVGRITRPKEHVKILFPRSDMETEIISKEICHFPLLFSHMSEISPYKIYQELVPFGPAYRNITRLHIDETGAIAYVKSPLVQVSDLNRHLLGSPFPLDAAFHAACVWGQRYSGVVGFPVGFEEHLILKPTQPEETYLCNIFPVEKINAKAFTVNIWIYDLNDTLCEVVTSVQMRDVSGGRIMPPQWLFEESSSQESE